MSEENKLITIFEFEDADASQKIEKTVKSIERLKIELEEVSSPLDKASQKIKEEGDAAEVTTVKLTGLAAAQKRMQDAADAASKSASSGSTTKVSALSALGGGSEWETQLAREEAARRAARERDAAEILTNFSKQNTLSDQLEKERTKAGLTAEQELTQGRIKYAQDRQKVINAEIQEEQKNIANAATTKIKEEANAASVVNQTRVKYAQNAQKLIDAEIAEKQKQILATGKAEAQAVAENLKGIAMRGRVQAQYAEQAAKAGVKYGEEIIKGGSAVEKGAKSATSAINQLFVAGTNLGRGLSRAGGEVGALGGPLMGLGYSGLAASRGVSALTALGPAVLGFAAALAVLGSEILILGAMDYAAFKAATSFGKFGEEIFKLEKETGLSASLLEGLYVVANETGTSMSTLATQASRLEVNISKGITNPSSEAGKSLKNLKLNLNDLATDSPDERMMRVASALRETTSTTDKMRDATGLLGRGFIQSREALDILLDGIENAKAKADAFGLALSRQEVEAAHKFEVAMRDLALGAEGLGVQVGERTAPMIMNALDNIGYALGINAHSWKDWGAYIGEVLAKAVYASEIAASSISNSMAMMVHSPGAAIHGAFSGIGTGIVTGSPEAGVATFMGIAGKPADDAQKNFDATLNSANIALNNALLPGPGKSWHDNVDKEPKGTFEGKGSKGKKGADPARLEEQLAKEQLKATELDLQAQENALNNSLHRRVVSLQEYTDQARQLEIERHKAVLGGLEKEKSVAESFKDPKKRAVEVQKVNNAIATEDEKYNQKRRELTNKTNDDEIARARATRESVLSIDEIKNKGLEQRLAIYVQAGIKTHEFAAREEKRIMLETSAAREEDLRKDIEDAGNDVAQKEKLQEEIRKLINQRAVDEENTYQKIKEARAQDIISMLEQQKTIEDINSRRKALNRNSLATSLNIMTMDGVYRERMIRQQAKLESDAEKEREKLAVNGLQRDIQVLEAKRIAQEINGQQALEQEKALSAEIEAIKSNSFKKIEEINAKSAKQISDHWKDVSSDISNILQDGIEKGWKGVLDDFKTMLFQINKELMSSSLMQILHPGQKQGTQTVGIAGAILNGIFGIVNKKNVSGAAIDPGMHSQEADHISSILPDALEHLSGNIVEMGAHTVQDIATTVTDVSVTGANTAAILANTTALGILTASMGAGGGGGWSDLFKTALSIGAGGGSPEMPWTAPPMANGGDFKPNSWHTIGERGPELLYTGPHAGTIIPNNIAFGGKQQGGNTYVTNNIQMPSRPKASYSQPRSDREQAEQLAGVLRKRMS